MFSFQDRHPNLPPTFKLSRVEQTRRFVTELGAFFEQGTRELGDAFSIDAIGYGPLVVLSDEESVKRLWQRIVDLFQDGFEAHHTLLGAISAKPSSHTGGGKTRRAPGRGILPMRPKFIDLGQGIMPLQALEANPAKLTSPESRGRPMNYDAQLDAALGAGTARRLGLGQPDPHEVDVAAVI